LVHLAEVESTVRAPELPLIENVAGKSSATETGRASIDWLVMSRHGPSVGDEAAAPGWADGGELWPAVDTG
jgi:hypothetical protein